MTISTDDRQPAISFIIPVYNTEKYLRECLDSVLAQTFTDFELILIDDGSTDSSPVICDAYAAQDHRVRVFHQENQGQAAARNFGVAQAKAERIAFVDGDDVVHPQYLEVLYRGINERNVKISMCLYIEAEEIPADFLKKLPAADYDIKHLDDETYLKAVKGIRLFDDVVWRMLMAKSILLQFPFTSGRICEDTAVVCRWMIAAQNIAVCHEALYFYRVNAAGTMQSAAHSLKQVDRLWALNRRMDCYSEYDYSKSLAVAAKNSYFWAAAIWDIYTEEFPDKKGAALTKKEFREMEKKYGSYAQLTEDEMDYIMYRFHPYRARLHTMNLLLKKYGIAGVLKKACGKMQHRKAARQVKAFLQDPTSITAAQAAALVNDTHRIDRMPFSQKTAYDIRYDLMIVVPVYNAQKYLEECITSVLNQKTKYSFLTVFVNDGSTDGSDAILSRYEARPNVKVIRQENRGFSGARNRALEMIYGRYVMFVDADDILADGAVEKLMEVAFCKDADIVEGGYMTFGEGLEDWIQPRPYDGPKLTDQTMLMGFPCMKVIRSDLFRDLCFPDGIWFEDTIMQMLLYPMCTNPYVIPDIVYKYRKHSESISATAKDNVKCLDTYWITQYCLEEKALRGQEFGVYENELFCRLLQINNRRLQKMPAEIQESVFVLSCGPYETYFKEVPVPAGDRFCLLNSALAARSYKAYKCIMENWDLLA